MPCLVCSVIVLKRSFFSFGLLKSDRMEKLLLYMQSVLMFIRHGDALEREGRSANAMYANRKETLRFCKLVFRRGFFSKSPVFRGSRSVDLDNLYVDPSI